MSISVLNRLAATIRLERDALLARWRGQVRELPSAKGLDTPTLNDHVPDLIEEIAVALETKSDQSIAEALIEGTPPAHGVQRLHDAFDIEEVVAEYNILRGCIHDLAEEHDMHLRGKSFHIVNRVLDQAIGLALQAYTTQRAMEVQRRREEYLSFVAHDLRTPLAAISFAGRVLELTCPPANAEGARVLKTLGRNVKQLEALINKVLEENANLQTETGVKLERREFDLWPLVEALVHDLHPVAGTASTKLVNNVPDDLVVYGDAGLLRRVFQNLIANAIKYTPRGEITIEAREVPAEGVVECTVSDNGTGISAEFLERVFVKGESDPDDTGGMGLGLAIVKTFTEAHGGKVTAESKEGMGSTFRVSLPTRKKLAESASQPS